MHEESFGKQRRPAAKKRKMSMEQRNLLEQGTKILFFELNFLILISILSDLQFSDDEDQHRPPPLPPMQEAMPPQIPMDAVVKVEMPQDDLLDFSHAFDAGSFQVRIVLKLIFYICYVLFSL